MLLAELLVRRFRTDRRPSSTTFNSGQGRTAAPVWVVPLQRCTLHHCWSDAGNVWHQNSSNTRSRLLEISMKLTVWQRRGLATSTSWFITTMFTIQTSTLRILAVKSNVLGEYTTWVMAAILDSRGEIKHGEVNDNGCMQEKTMKGHFRNLPFISTILL